MAEDKIGLFISQLRKEKKMTQKELAKQLHITDKAVSKWERGLSYPDISLLNSLAEILGVATSELLNGERNDVGANDVDATIDNALVYADMSAAVKINSFKKFWTLAFSLSLLLGIIVCVVCDIAISGTFTWSRYPTSSVLFAWLVLLPLVKSGEKGIVCSLAALSLLIVPFLCVLDYLIGGASIVPIGTYAALVSILYLWIVWFLFHKMKSRKWLAGGVSLLLSVPLCLAINGGVAHFLSQPMFDMWDLISCVVLFVAAALLVFIDYLTVHRS